jgi:ATP-dependent Clp protease ATP-binding subunit ClpA
MATLEIYRDRFAESGWEIFERALGEAGRRGQNRVGVEHILYALAVVRAELFGSMLRTLSENPEALTMLLELIEERTKDAPKHEEGQGIRLATETISLFKRTLRTVRSNGRRRIEASDLFLTLLMDEASLLRELLRQLLADPQAEARQVRNLITLVEPATTGRRPARGNFLYSMDEMVRIKSGPFASFTGKVQEVDEDNSTLKVRVFIMGREQPVELRFLDVEKIDFIK